MTVLYTAEEALLLRRRYRAFALFACSLLGAAFIACVALCILTNTGNARKMAFAAIALFTVAGWICILVANMAVLPARAEAKHMQAVLGMPSEQYCGRLETTALRFHIPQSVTVRKVMIDDGNERHVFHVWDRKAALLPPDGTAVRIRAARQFIMAFEVEHENI